MSAPCFTSAARLRANPDAALVASLPPAKPLVIVLGAHRSGTTYLYQLLTDMFPFAVTRVFHVTHYRELLSAQRDGRLDALRQEVRDYLKRRGIENRGIDAFGIEPDALEEYAFILRKFTPDWGFTPRSAQLFDELARKLSALQPEAPALLLKNPFDLGHAGALLTAYPEAKLIFIRRDPVRVLNSQFRNSFLYREKPEPYLEMLLAGIPAWRLAFTAMAAADRVLPDGFYQRLLVNGLRRSIAGQLRRHHAELPELPRDRYVEVHYEALMADPAPSLERIRAFVGLTEREDAQPIARSPREEPLLPAVAAVADAFRSELADTPDVSGALAWERP